MTTQLLVPKLGFAMIEGEISEWLVADGATVSAGQPIYALESDKSVTEVEAPIAGVLTILAPIGGPYPVSSVVGEIN
jgi:pyruvate/2-oxoglutarate dehydrogenase complex dihydrolipoamide acyltransferase (E2) component